MAIEGITVSGRNMMLGDALVEQVGSRMTALSEKYFGRLITTRVTFSKAERGIKFGCTIRVTVGHDLHYVSEAHQNDVRGCFNEAYEHLAKQLRRSKRELHEDKPHRHRKDAAFQNMSAPEPSGVNGMVLPIDGEQLSIADVDPDAGSKIIQAWYGHQE